MFLLNPEASPYEDSAASKVLGAYCWAESNVLGGAEVLIFLPSNLAGEKSKALSGVDI